MRAVGLPAALVLPPYPGEVQVSVNRIPEPSAFIIWSLLATLGITVGWWRRRRVA